MKYSKQRELIRQAVAQTTSHPTADEIYSRLKTEVPGLSLATVYRNLNVLAESGEIQKIPVPNGSDRFDARTDEHYHMTCVRCGCVYDVMLNIRPELERQLDGQCELTGHHLMLYGICDRCKRQG